MDTQVYLLNVPLENDHKHTLYFTSKEQQQAYFESKIVKRYTNSSYQRKDSIIRVPDNYDNISPSVNYVMYKNPSFSNKWFYAFIKEVEYKNTETTWIHIETDVIQTWLFDYTIKPSFVEREHVLDDYIGLHIIPEGLETGEYVCNKHSLAEYSGKEETVTSQTNLSIVVGVTSTPEGENVEGGLYNNIYSGLKYYSFPADTDGVAKLNEFINKYPNEGKAEAITCMFLAPDKITGDREDNTVVKSNLTDSYYINSDTLDPDSNINKEIDFSNGNIDGYLPRNNKLFTFPYRYLLASNNCGTDVIYNYEDFYKKVEIENDGIIKEEKSVRRPKFIIKGCLTVGCSIRMIPLDYKGAEYNDAEGINLGKFPSLNWNTDVYTNWLTQNGLNVGLSVASGIGQIVAGGAIAAASGGLGLAVGGSSIVGGVSTITNTLAQIHEQSFAPPQSQGNINNGDVITAWNRNDFHFYDMTIKSQYAEILDGYFDMFGYKVNIVKVPNKEHRERYWYTKTIDVNIDGAIPNNDMQKIKDCYNNGITFWRNANEIQDYSLSNGIV